jgi:hypothetical protein
MVLANPLHYGNEKEGEKKADLVTRLVRQCHAHARTGHGAVDACLHHHGPSNPPHNAVVTGHRA